MDKLKKFNNKKIAFLGLGIENYSLIKFFISKKINCEITICDNHNSFFLGDKFTELKKYKNINWRLEKNFNKNLAEFNFLFRSPGWPISCPGIQEALKINKKIILTSPIKLFFYLSPSKKIIGVTGTKGKGTTSSLIYEILKKGEKKVWLGGNIGVAPFSFINNIKSTDWVILELSSFQLEDLSISPKISIVTNFSKEHLSPADPYNPNFHKSLTKYKEAKLNIVKYQKKNNFAILNKKLKNDSWKKGSGKKIYFSSSELISRLPGDHNKENIAAAVAVAKLLKINKRDIEIAIKSFSGLEHRIELVRNFNGVKYYDDSFATTPESAITALKSFNNEIILIAGGADKGSDFKNFAKEIKKRVKFLILLDGAGTRKIERELININYSKEKAKLCFNIKNAIMIASRMALKNEIVLLSTGCASFGMFKNYKERGDLFKKEVNNLK